MFKLFVIFVLVAGAVDGAALKELVKGLEAELEGSLSNITAEDANVKQFRLDTVGQIKLLTHNLTMARDDFEAKDQALDNKDAELDRELESQSARIDARGQEIEDLGHEVWGALQDLVAEDARLSALNHDLRVDFEAEAKSLEARDTELERKIEVQKISTADLRKDLEAKDDAILKELRKDRWELDAKDAQLDADTAALDKALSQAYNDIDDLGKEVKQDRKELDAKDHSHDYDIIALEIDLEKLDRRTDATVKELKAKDQELESKDQELVAKDQDLEAENRQLRSDIHVMKLDLEQKDNEISKILHGVKEDLEKWKNLSRVKGTIINSGLSTNMDGSPEQSIYDGDTASGAGTNDEYHPWFGAKLDTRFKAFKLVLFGINNLRDDVYTVSVFDSDTHRKTDCATFSPGGDAEEFRDYVVECHGVGEGFEIRVENPRHNPTSLYLYEVEAYLVI